MRSGIKTWCDLHKRNADSLIKPSCGCRLCKELPKNHPINLSTILQECGEEGGEEKDGCEDAEAGVFLYPLHAEGSAFPAHKPEDGKEHVEVGVGKQGDQAGVEEKNRVNVLTAALFFFLHLFCPRIWFPSEGGGLSRGPGLCSAGAVYSEKQRFFPSLYISACFWGEGRGGEKKMEYSTEFLWKQNHSEKMQFIWILSRRWQQTKKEKKKKKQSHILPVEFLTGKLFFRKDGMSFPCNFPFHFSSSVMQEAC